MKRKAWKISAAVLGGLAALVISIDSYFIVQDIKETNQKPIEYIRDIFAEGIKDIKENRRRPNKYVEQIFVNTSKDYKFVVNQSELEGILKMRALVSESKLEEAAAYLPKKEEWVEIGVDERINQVPIGWQMYFGVILGKQPTVTMHRRTLKDIIKKNDKIILYHFHPSEEENCGVIRISDIKPSQKDIQSMLISSKKFYEKHPSGFITFKICSLFGVTEYRLTEEGKEFCKNIKEVNLNQIVYAMFNDYQLVTKVADSKVQSIHNINSPRFTIEFKPYDKILKDGI